jgi:hypothetical protein
MNHKLPEEDIIRKYLLGILREPELSVIEQKLLSSEELSETADLIEDEIIEQYLDGDLDERDKKAVETHFLRPPAHREKLRFARLLRYHFETSTAEALDLLEPIRRQRHPAQLPRFLWTYGGAAAAVLLGVFSLYLSVAQRGLTAKVVDSQKTQAALQADLAREREHSAMMADELQALQGPSLVMLDLRPGVSRSNGLVEEITIRPSTRFLRASLLLPQGTPSAALSRVRLEDAEGNEVWSQTGLRPVPVFSRSQVEFYVPAQGFKSGGYDFLVESNQGVRRYPFYVDVVK